jgi:hypothetical protein
MEILEAQWDKSNLGVRSHVISINRILSADDILEIKNLDSEYVIAKVEYVDLNRQLSDLGFTFAEKIESCVHNLATPKLAKIQARLLSKISLKKVSKSERDDVIQNIDADMFVTDRIAMDPAFGPSIARNRYVNWITDITSNNGELYELILGGDRVGFFCIQQINEKVTKGILSGVYAKWRGKGFAIYLNYFQILLAQRKGSQFLETAYSSNNPQVRQVHESLGFKISKIEEVYISHKS